ncbi:MAG: SCO family protein [Terrimicrobiaceae bacterium]|jgi:protein SCO1/2|nr:SCO family protein [Terrimicrobiaceae bacterium]
MAETRQTDARSRRIGLILFAACAAVAIPALIVLFSLAGKSSSPWFGQYDAETHPAFDFSLTDQNGNPLRLQDLRGQVVLLSFGFTRCPNICPTTLGNLAAVYRKLPPAAQERTKVVFVSVDERDSPEALKEYVPFFNERFLGLTGSPAEIGTTARAYGAFFRKAAAVGSDKDDYLIDHSTYTHLIDPDGNLRVLYRFEQLPETDKIAEDVQRVLDMQAPGKQP